MRPAARSYLISPAALGPLAADPDRISDRTSSAYLVASAARAITEVSAAREGADRAGKRLPTLTVHADIRFATPADQHGFAEELARALAALVTRYHDDKAPRGRAFRVMAGAWPAPAPEAP
jgi:hypothetical protein